MTGFALQAQPADAVSWLALATRAEQAGFDTLQAADHPGSCAAPFVALAAAAAVTTRIRLGSYVSNAGVREAIHLATDVATLDVVSGGRARIGIGAGHTPAEWQAIGRDRPDVRGRVDRCLAVAEAVRRLLDGETARVGDFEARLTSPRPVQQRIPLVLGTANSRLLRWAGAHADVVGLSGLGRTQADGHSHEARWRPEQIDRQVEQVRAGTAERAGTAGRSGTAVRAAGPELEALVQIVELTDDAQAAAAPHAAELGMPVADLLEAPFVLIGTAAEMRAAAERHAKRWGITRYAVREPALETIAEVFLSVGRPVRPGQP